MLMIETKDAVADRLHEPVIGLPNLLAGTRIKALTISQPFASLIAEGKKWVENRCWYTGYRGPLAIHAGKGTQYVCARVLRTMPSGCVVAVARLVACVQLDVWRDEPPTRTLPGTGKTCADLFSHEHSEGPYCWVLEHVRRLAVPSPCRGAQGLWDWTVQDELEWSR